MSIEFIQGQEEVCPPEAKYHIEGSHCICEDGKPVIVSSLWKCIQRVRQMESEMVRYYEHSDLTIMPYEQIITQKFDEEGNVISQSWRWPKLHPLKEVSNYDEQPISRFK